MQTFNVKELEEKKERTTSPVNGLIRNTLDAIEAGQAILMTELADDVVGATGMKKEQVYVRIGTVLQSKKYEDLHRFVRKGQNETLIGRYPKDGTQPTHSEED